MQRSDTTQLSKLTFHEPVKRLGIVKLPLTV